ncbi:TraM recognition domain-containing protein [Nocardia sp. CC227C]|uniref:TraM recognition domain-containing protein n=1 Tax=Nocardia sp. CC227C TaxID=3044562 RepID=UPI00278C3FA4|nr:hypothetical protein [Nocardia sp. CC227C]
MTPTRAQRPADCAPLLDFRPACNGAPAPVPADATGCTPVFTESDCTPPTSGIPSIRPEAPPIPGSDFGPLEHLDGLNLPNLDAITTALHVGSVFTGTVAGVGAAALTAAWMWTWTPVRLRNFAFGSASIPGAAVLAHGLSEPADSVARGAGEVLAGMPVTGIASASVALIPAGLIAAATVAARYEHLLDTRGRRSPDRTERAVWARHTKLMRAATRMSQRGIPLTSGTIVPEFVLGRAAYTVSQAPMKGLSGRLTARQRSLFTVPWLAFREHGVWLGNPGSGKTTGLERAVMSFWATAWRRHQQWWRSDRPGRPLAVVIDAKGARDARATARRLRAAARKLGIPPERILIWPDDPDTLSLFFGTCDEQRPRFEALLGAGIDTDNMDPAQAYYMGMRKTIAHLVVDMPDPAKGLGPGENPPRDSREFERRMIKDTLIKAWKGHPGELSDIAAATNGNSPVLPAERSAVANLFRDMGAAFDGDRALTDYDLVYCCLEGTTAADVAAAQFRGLISLVAGLAKTDHGRVVQLFCDEFAQVCGDDGAARVVELMRSAGCGSLWFSQSWMGLGPTDDARHRLVDSCSGGIFVMRSYSAGQLSEKIGTRTTYAKSRKLIDGLRHGDEGNVQPEETFLVSPKTLAAFNKGDIVHVCGGCAVFGHITPLDIDALRPLPGLAESTAPQANTALIPEIA